MTVFKLRQDNPRRNDAEDRDAEVEANADEVVRAALGLHSVHYCQ